jgi:3-oxoacyl-[acyl-carrier protein] reductase
MKTILVIGASSAVAKSFSEAQLKLGNRVIGISREDPRIAHLEFIRFDLSQSAHYPALEGSIDALVYFPGTITLKPFKGLKQHDIQSDFDINVLGAIRAVQSYSANLQLSNHASIVFFSTVAVQLGMPFHASVAVSKGAIEALTRSLAAEFAPKIRVNCIAPSLTNTPLAERLLNSPEKMDASSNRHPLKKIGEPEDLANAASFLITDDSKWMTGQVLHLDGGLSTIRI